MKPNDWLPSETLYAFAGWLTSRDEAVTMSGQHDATPAAELVAAFCKRHGLNEPREGWDKARSSLSEPMPDAPAGGEAARLARYVLELQHAANSAVVLNVPTRELAARVRSIAAEIEVLAALLAEQREQDAKVLERLAADAEADKGQHTRPLVIRRQIADTLRNGAAALRSPAPKET